MTDYKKLCAELVYELEGWVAYGDEIDIANAHALIDRACDALASTTEQPTDEDLLNLYEWMADEWAANHDFELPPSQYARAVLARWGRSQSAPNKPTVMEIIELADKIEEAGLGQVDLVRVALDRWGNHPINND